MVSAVLPCLVSSDSFCSLSLEALMTTRDRGVVYSQDSCREAALLPLVPSITHTINTKRREHQQPLNRRFFRCPANGVAYVARQLTAPPRLFPLAVETPVQRP